MALKIYAFYSIKGGVGKTATAVNLACLSAEAGYRTLLWDLDPQGAATYYFRVKPSSKLNPAKLLNSPNHLSRRIRESDFENLDLLPSSLAMRNLDIELDHVKRSRKRLGEVLSNFDAEYDRVLLDCPPSINLLSENVFRAADKMVVPIIPTTLSLLTFNQLNRFLKEENLDRRKLLPFFSMVDGRKKLHREVMQILASDARLLKTRIPMSADVEKMGVFRQPYVSQVKNSSLAQLYRRLWQEIENA